MRIEMLEKFGLEFRIVDTDYIRKLRRSRGSMPTLGAPSRD